jgi:hypothetical protein
METKLSTRELEAFSSDGTMLMSTVEELLPLKLFLELEL